MLHYAMYPKKYKYVLNIRTVIYFKLFAALYSGIILHIFLDNCCLYMKTSKPELFGEQFSLTTRTAYKQHQFNRTYFILPPYSKTPS